MSLSRPGGSSDRLGILRAAGLAMAPSGRDDSLCHLSEKLGVALLDYDLDGRIDIVSGNGLAEPALLHFEHSRAFASAPELLWNDGQGGRARPPRQGAAPSAGR